MIPAGKGQGGARLFRDVVVAPTESVVGKRTRAEFQGGPLWPDFAGRVAVRHCRGTPPLPFDVAPTPPAQVDDGIEAAIWCGPICPHFGHGIADFAMRIADSAHRTDLPLLFSHWPGGGTRRPAWFDGILAQFGVPETRLLIRDAPIRVARLHVFPQAERIGGTAPAAAYLDLLDRVTPGDVDEALAGATVFVSRSRIHRLTLAGRIAGETWLDRAMAAAGAVVLHPETRPLAEQLRLYRSARRLVFSEGSALHALQLLGRIRAEVSVLVRRPGVRMAGRAIGARTGQVHWLEPLRGVVAGRGHEAGRPDASRALTLLDATALREAIGETTGLSLAPHWDEAAWEEAWRRDLSRWLRARAERVRGGPKEDDDAAAVRRSLEALGLG
jgi:hypothetical protein